MRSYMIWIGLICCVLSVQAQYPGYTPLAQTDAFKKAFSQNSAGIQSIQSDFRQEKNLSMLSEKIISTGKFWFQQKDKIRMEYQKPYSYLMIMNGGRIFVKEGEKTNQISTSSNKVFQQVNRILIDCIAGNMFSNPDFQSKIFENSSNYLAELTPVARNLSALYKNINIVIEKKDLSILYIEMVDVSGDKTLIRFQNKIMNAQIPESVFNIP